MRLKPYEAYLFDLDGTLVDTAPDLMNSLNHCLALNNYSTTDIELTRHWVGFGARVMIKEAIAYLDDSTVSAQKLDTMYAEFLIHYQQAMTEASKPYPTVVDTLEELHRRTGKLGVVTNKRADLATQLLNELDLYKYFQIIVGGDTMQVQKPAAEPALYACNELNVAPERTLFVGDSITDVDCARAAGCAVVCTRDGYNHGTPACQLGADAVIAAFSELL